MVAQGNGQFKQSYQVNVSGKISNDLDELKAVANGLGIGDEFTVAWDTAFQRLGTDPWGFGELFKPKLKVHVRLLKPLLIEAHPAIA